jgi:hydroxymethylpyrimidine/phosphomethylpyrimidine kinase
LSADSVAAQIEAVASDMRLGATKIGMLATAAIVEAVAATITALDLPLVVVDPVFVSSSGQSLLDADGIQALVTTLLPKARVVTPNITEAEALSGCRIHSAEDVRKAARRIHDITRAAVVVTGGHAQGAEVVDLLFDAGEFAEFRTPRLDVGPVHGTGCTFASALAARLASGHTLAESAGEAQVYVAGAIAHSLQVGTGARVLDHFWQRR